MLHAMQQPTATSPSPASPSFAGLLAALATPALKPEDSGDGYSPQGRRPAPTWNDDDLADDIATLSYERALRAHARYRSASSTDQSLTQPPADPGPIALRKPEASRPHDAPFERNLKDASITIRMSKAECAQLHRRAADAGLTVSAYLRSCTFEAESLRAMVKDTLGQLRSATSPANPAEAATPKASATPEAFLPGGRTHWLARLFTPWLGNRRAVSA
jgi:hypothetical protein